MRVMAQRRPYEQEGFEPLEVVDQSAVVSLGWYSSQGLTEELLKPFSCTNTWAAAGKEKEKHATTNNSPENDFFSMKPTAPHARLPGTCSTTRAHLSVHPLDFVRV